MKNYLLLIIIWSLLTAKIQAQIDILPKTAASPNVAMLDKFQNINVGTYTGVPNLSIPLYTLIVDGVELPIVLRYNSSGIKVGEEATWVGLGWDLSVGGNITHSPVGESDQTDNLSVADYNQLIDKVVPGFNLFSGRSERGWVWAECVPLPGPGEDSYSLFQNVKLFQLGRPDNYSYSFPHGSGKFYFDPITKKPVLYGNKNGQVFIERPTPSLNQWTIIDLNGIKYQFYQRDLENTEIYPPKNPSYGNSRLGSETWWLSKINLPSGKQINFTYANDSSYTSTKSQTYTRNYLADSKNYTTDNPLSQATHHAKKLTFIETDNEKIEFELSSTKEERADLQGGMLNGVYSAKRLNAIHIWDKIQNKKIKTFRFYYDYFKGGCSGGTINADCARLKLTSLREVGYTADQTEDTNKPPYQFAYNETNPLPSKQSYAVDFWGYYNGQTSNTGLLPKVPEGVLMGLFDMNNFPIEVAQDFSSVGNANRGMDPAYATSGLISRITYPTGGYLQLNYEANNFSNYSIFSATDLGNAQQINLYKNIEVHDLKICGDELPKQSTIFYPRKNGTLTLLNLQIGFSIISATAPDYDADHEYNKYGKAYVSLFRIDSEGNTSIVETWKVRDFSTFRIGHPDILNVTKLSYTFNSTDKYYFECSLGADVPCHVGMPGNTPFHGSVSCTCSVFDPTVQIPANNPNYKPIGGGVRIASQETYDQNGKLAFKRSYKYVNLNGSTSGKIMSPVRFFAFRSVASKSESTPQVFFPGAYTFSISSNSYTPLAPDANGAVVGYSRVEVTDIDYLNNTNGKTVYYYRNTPSTTGSTEMGLPNLPYEDNGLEDSIQIWNSTNKLMQKTINTFTSIENTNAYGVTIVDNYIGPDHNGSGGGLSCYNPWAYQGRWTVNYYPIQTRWYILSDSKNIMYPSDGSGSNPVSTLKTYTYNAYGQPSMETIKGSDENLYSTSSLYPFDDNSGNALVAKMINKGLYNNLLSQSQLKNGTTQISYKKWHYVENTNGNIKVNSLEQSNQGGTAYNPIKEVLYDLRDNVTQAKQNETYISYLWGYNQTYPVVKIENKAYSAIPQSVKDAITGHTFSGSTEYSSITADVAYLKTQLSTLLSDATCMVTYYTYAPLIGMTSQTDPGGVTIYYEYDTFGRLKCTRNDDGNILKTYEYNYKP